MAKAKKKVTKKKTVAKKKTKKLTAAQLKKLKGGAFYDTQVPTGFSRATFNERFGDRTPVSRSFFSGSRFSDGGRSGGGSGATRGKSGR